MQGFPVSQVKLKEVKVGLCQFPQVLRVQKVGKEMMVAKVPERMCLGMGLPGSGMPAWGAGGCYPMPGPNACFGTANGPGIMLVVQVFQNVPNFGQVPSNPFVAGQVPSSFQGVPNPCLQNMSSEVPSVSRFHREV